MVEGNTSEVTCMPMSASYGHLETRSPGFVRAKDVKDVELNTEVLLPKSRLNLALNPIRLSLCQA